jgi:DNA polymerase-3 subunit delta'
VQGARTRGHPTALGAIGAMIRGPAPHAVLIVGPPGVGKATLAGDLAAGLLCTATEAAAGPCRACRACRLVEHGSHPDLHRLGPEGPGRQVVIGGAGSKSRGVRDLITDLALLPVEGGARVAIVDGASRMNEDAQAALLKTLEEPPDGVTIVLCADAEEPLMPTIRSRCARIRLGPVATRDVEGILADAVSVEPALAARLARISGGRPGIALAWAADPDALRARDELVRTLLDLADQRPAVRLAAVRAAMTLASSMEPALATDRDVTAVTRATRGRTAPPPAASSERPSDPDAAEVDDGSTPAVQRAPASERRRAAERLVELWTDVARDIALCQRGIPGAVREIGLLDETSAIAARLDEPAVAEFLEHLGRAAVLLASNVSPELVIDDLALAMPVPTRAAA